MIETLTAEAMIARWDRGEYPAPVEIRLTDEELLWADDCARQRREESEKANQRHLEYAEIHRDRTFSDWVRLNQHAVGGEIAAAKALGVEWVPTVNVFRDAGGDGIQFEFDGRIRSAQVKQTDRPEGNLIYRPQDPDSDDVHILVCGFDPYLVRGWVWRTELDKIVRLGRSWASLDGGKPCRMIDKLYLNPIQSLKDAIIPHALSNRTSSGSARSSS